MQLSAISLALTRLGWLSTFTPASLFTTGVNGVWYDPSDYGTTGTGGVGTLFQDAAGTTPVTAVEQPVGLMLDKSKGLVLGSELVTNGDFSNGTTGWSPVLATLAVVSGELEITVVSTGAARRANQSFAVESGKWYEVRAFQRSTTTATSVRVGTTSGGGEYFNEGASVGTSKTTRRFIFTTGTTLWVSLVLDNSTAGQAGYFDNISVRELPGNHAFNGSGNSANFPVLSARYNLLTKSEDFSDAVWVKNGASVTPNSTVAPDGSLTADTLSASSSTTTAHVYQSISNVLGYTHSFYAKAGTSNFVCITTNTNACYANFNLATGVVASSANCTATITSAGNGWYKCSITNVQNGIYFMILGKDADPAAQPYGNGTWTSGNNIYIWGADLRVANDALNQPAYQRVNTSTDYDTVGFKPYLRFNGTNQWLQTNSIDFSYGDKMFVSAGVRKLSDAATGVFAEISSDATVNLGVFSLYHSSTTTVNGFGYFSRGTGAVSAASVTSGFSPPVTSVLAGIGNISGDQSTLRVNGTQAAINAGDQGTGNYGNYPLYIGARAGSSLWFNGRLYGMVVAGKQASAVEITSTETYINQKTGAYA